jgi:hypothetical protein
VLLGVQVSKETIDGVKRPRDAMVYGCWHREVDAEPHNSTVGLNATNTVVYIPDDAFANPQDPRLKQIVPISFELDVDNHLVRFRDPVFMQTTDNGIAPADLRLRTSCYLKIPETGELFRDRHVRMIRNSIVPYAVDLIHDEITPTIRATYNASMLPDSVITNATDILLEIDHYLTEAFRHYSTDVVPQTAEYGGWRFDVDLDGAIQSITWTLDAQGGAPTTIIERNHDSGRGGIPYNVTRAHQRNADAQRKADQAEWRGKQLRYIIQAKGGK